MQIILFQPEIPQNTGNIIRTCSLTNTKLSVVTPLSFSLNDRNLKRA
ncbi:MAG: tRNA (cytidine(34)-2'-O)-methyltransferase, partial [Candidatus Anoxychlamydiales bacterium]|nr:tRNA (cytidine(34)-2'-O)-methyltransferase [Candidatus Anoxychlamydiales bacterium]